jgi:NitT/TauT family transport system substrate-binding protein
MTKLHVRRRTVLASASALAIGGLAAPFAARAQGKPEKPKVVLAVGGKSALYYLSVTVAETKGFFKEAGLDVEINDFQGGAKSLQALMGGSADVVAGAYEHTIRMQQRGQPIVAFALIGRGMQLAIGLRNEVAAKVKGPADLKGLKFGVTAPGSQTHMLVNSYAAKGGLKASDIVAIGVGAGASVVAGIEKGELDGVSQADPALTILQEKGLIKILLDTRTMKGNQDLFGGSMPAACLYSQPDLVTKTPNTAQALATAIVRANQWLQTAPPSEVSKAVPEAYLLGDRAIYEKAFLNVRDTISPDGVMPEDGPRNCLKFLAESDPKIEPAKIKLADTFTNEFALRAAKRS